MGNDHSERIEDGQRRRFRSGQFNQAEQFRIDQGRCPVCERALDWIRSTMDETKIVLCCGHHGGGFVHVVDVGSHWAECAKQFGTETPSPCP